MTETYPEKRIGHDFLSVKNRVPKFRLRFRHRREDGNRHRHERPARIRKINNREQSQLGDLESDWRDILPEEHDG